MNENLQTILESAPQIALSYGIKFALAIAVYVIGKWLASTVSNLLLKGLTARGVDATICQFTRNIAFYALLTMVIVAALGQLGVQTASFVAIIGAAGLAVGFALQGSLANFAAGVLLILFRPFKIGDFVEAGGSAGVVKEISIFSTIFNTPDNKTVIISNSAVMGGNITNYSMQPERRVDFTIGVSYKADLDRVRSVLTLIANEDPRILQNKEITIGVGELADSSINIVFRVWTETANYWGVFFDTLEKVKKRFDDANIEIPYPQMDVYIQQNAAIK